MIAEMMDCSLERNDCKPYSCYYVHFLTNTVEKAWTRIQGKGSIVSVLFYKDEFDIKLPTKANMLFNKESKCLPVSMFASVTLRLSRRLVLWEIQTALSRVWTHTTINTTPRALLSIYLSNSRSISLSLYIYIYIYIYMHIYLCMHVCVRVCVLK